MKVRNCTDIGINAQYIVKRLMANQNLLKLLYYTDKDPLSHEDLTQEQIQNEIFEKLIKIVPRVGPKETAHSIIAVRIARGRGIVTNSEFKSAIMGEIQKSLDGKKIEGLGKLTGGDFDLNFLTEEISAYEQTFSLTSYD